MAELLRKENEPVKLRLSLNRDETTKYVRAFLTDSAGNPVPPGTLDLSHLANGVYGENAFVMPNVDTFDVKYRVYLDAGFSVLDPTYPSAFDVVRKDTGSQVEGVGGVEVTADLSGAVEESAEISGTIQEPELSITGSSFDTDIEGVVEEESDL